MTSFEATNSVFNISDENNSFSNSTPNQWIPEDGEELINKLNELLELRSENDIELHAKEVEERGTLIEIENRGYNLTAFDYVKSEILAELKRVKYNLEVMVYRMDLPYHEIVDILDVKYFVGSTIGYTLSPGIYAKE